MQQTTHPSFNHNPEGNATTLSLAPVVCASGEKGQHRCSMSASARDRQEVPSSRVTRDPCTAFFDTIDAAGKRRLHFGTQFQPIRLLAKAFMNHLLPDGSEE